jgi:hypothetical protein
MGKVKPRVSNEDLVAAGLELMRSAGQPLTRVETGNRSMKYTLANGQSVRIRTCNDHVLVVLADSPEPNAKLNIEGTDHLLIVMPRIPRTDGPVDTYFVPTQVVVDAARKAHTDWLASQPSTKGNNRTWNLWFDDTYAEFGGGFGRIWAKYRLSGESATTSKNQERTSGGKRSLGEVIAAARKEIADAAGVSVEAVKISVALD